MDHQHGHGESHRQAREHKKADHTPHHQGGRLTSVHPAWYVVMGVILCGAALLVWMLF